MQPIAVAVGKSPVITIRSAATAKVNVQRLRGNVNVLTGSGGNIIVLIGRDGKVLVDAGTTASRPQITAAVPCRQSYSEANKLFISTAQRLRLRSIPMLTRIPISQCPHRS